MSGTVRQDDVCNEVLSQSRAGCRCGRKFVQDPRDRAKREPIIPGEWLPESRGSPEIGCMEIGCMMWYQSAIPAHTGARPKRCS